MNQAISDTVVAARAAQEAGQLEAALSCWETALGLARTSNDGEAEAYVLRHHADLARTCGRFSQSLASAEAAIALYQQGTGDALDLANARRLAALALKASGRSDEARQFWTGARHGYLQAGVAAGVAECDQNLAP